MNKIKSKTAMRFMSIAFIISLLWSQTVWALPQDGTVVGGSSTITQPNATTMQINQTTDKSIINWQGYSIGANERVQYNQPNSGSISVNRVVGQDPSLIYGQLSANGQVWVINPNGLLIGNGAGINVGSFLGSTLNINDNDFMNGNYKFINTTGSLSSITNQGNINAADGGYVVLISPSISNEGNITTNFGKTYLASADEVTLNFAGNDLIGFTIDKAAAETLLNSPFDKGGQGGILNTGTITADGGQVILSAKVAGDILKTVINNEGVIQAQTIEEKNGVIKLLGGMENNAINVGGTLDASAPNGGDGGFIETSAASVKIADDAKITTASSNGKTGEWLIDPTDYNIAASSGDITGAALSTNLGTTNVTILSSSGATGTSGDVNVNDAVSWSANNTLTLSAYRNVNVNSNITATGNTAGLVLTPDTCGGACTGTYSLNNGAVITLSGTTPSLTIAGNAYTVINSLGAQGSGTGTDLQGMSGNLTGYYAIGSNIDATATSGWNAGAGFVPVGDATTQFTGAFDGLGHTITGLTINRPATDFVGLFGYINGATIRNVGLVGGSVRGQNEVGGLAAGMSNLGAITNSYSTANVTGSGYDVGGLVGGSDGIITNSYSTGTVSGTDFVGGLAGYNWGTITNSYSTGNVSGNYSVGGLLGSNAQGTITNSYSTGNVSGTDYVGGLVGGNYATITNSYATGSVSGATNVGGLVGYNNVAGTTITNSYWDTQTSGWVTSSGGTGLTTAQMMQQANFTGLDFTNTWWMSEGNTRPFLRSEYSTNITNAHQLQLMGMNATTSAASYTLAANISMAELSQASGLWGTTTGFVPVGNAATGFTGAFDGLGHTITSLYINRPTTNFVGLFGYTNGMAIRNVGLVGGSVTGNYNVGGLVGRNVGGGTTTNSYNTGTVSGNSTSWYVGGLLGYNNGAISNSYSTGTVSGGVIAVGGLVGMNFATITNSYATGSVSGTDEVGGLVGDNYGTITTSYSAGTVSGTGDVGGLVGYNNSSTITNSYWDTQTSGWATSAGGTGLTTAQMKTMANYTGWSISNSGGSSAVWRIYEGNTYPLLKSFLTSLTITADNVTKTYDGAAWSATLQNVNYSGADTSKIFNRDTPYGSGSGKNVGSYTPKLYSNQQGYDISYTNGTLTVNAKALTLASLTASNKIYDGNTTATISSYGSLSGVVSGDTVSLNSTSATKNFDNKNVGTGKTVTVASLALSGTDAGNYSVADQTTTANVTARSLTISGSSAADKVYDGNTTATVTAGTLSGLVGTETLGVSGSGTFDTPNVGTGKTVAASYSLSNGTNGGLAGNYTLAGENLTANITGDTTTTATTTTTTTTDAGAILDMYPILKTENITDQKIVSAGTPAAELFTAKAVNYTIEQTVFGYQPPKGDSLSIEDENKKIERQKREQKIEKRK